MSWFEGFPGGLRSAGGVDLFVRTGGKADGPPVLLDIVPTLDVYERTDMRLASLYYHWFFLIQPAPLPERMIGGDPAYYLRWMLGGFGSQGIGFVEPEALAEYERCFCRAETI